MSKVRLSIKHLSRRIIARPFIQSCLWHLARTNLIPQNAWMHVAACGTFRIHIDSRRSFLYHSTVTDLIGRSLRWGGVERGRESETIAVFLLLASKCNVILDIGANTGLYTLIACAVNPNARLIAFEPVPAMADRLQEHLRLNDWLDRCVLHRSAATDRAGTTVFHVPFGDSPTSGSLNPDGFRGKFGNLIEVSTTTIDEACKQEENISLVKIDVEGFEDSVLMGMALILEQHKPVIFIECNADGPFAKVEAILTAKGYAFFHLTSAGPERVLHIVPDTTERFRNFLCVPATSAESLQRLFQSSFSST